MKPKPIKKVKKCWALFSGWIFTEAYPTYSMALEAKEIVENAGGLPRTIIKGEFQYTIPKKK